MKEIPPRYNPQEREQVIYSKWEKEGFFHAEPNPGKKPFSIVIPPPNVTGILHMGHALNNTLQDILIRWKRMQGFVSLWVPGTDHAGIATQNVVERKLRAKGKSRQELGREAFVREVWDWREQYGNTIISQLKRLGSSCDWQRTRFTMDKGLSEAVLEAFVRLYKKGFIYRGNYIINWCPRCQTALSDEEAPHVSVHGKLYYIKYPFKQRAKGSKGIVVATTRPETMLGDTAVAINPEDPRHKGQGGKIVILPLLKRELPVIEDSYVDTEFGTGALKVTPAHDPNDYEVARRQNLPMINIINPDGTLNDSAGPYQGLKILPARKRVVADLEALELVDQVEDREIDLAHSDRSKTPIEPCLADQWFVKMEHLAQSAMDAVSDARVKIVPPRYARGYLDWLSEKRDWPVSRQLWWGHQIPIWYAPTASEDDLKRAFAGRDDVVWQRDDEHQQWLICAQEVDLPEDAIAGHEITREVDVLDTWFSSALWPHSTLGWPDKTSELDYFYPTSTLITNRDIITL